MTHYVCTGNCGKEADKPAVCNSDDCSNEGQALVACTCEDGLHEEVLDADEEEKPAE